MFEFRLADDGDDELSTSDTCRVGKFEKLKKVVKKTMSTDATVAPSIFLLSVFYLNFSNSNSSVSQFPRLSLGVESTQFNVSIKQ